MDPTPGSVFLRESRCHGLCEMSGLAPSSKHSLFMHSEAALSHDLLFISTAWPVPAGLETLCWNAKSPA